MYNKILVLCDYSWMLRRFDHVFKNLSVTLPDGSNYGTGVVFGFTRFVESIFTAYENQGKSLKIIFCMDSKSDERSSQLAEYKSNRIQASNKNVLASNTALVYQLMSLVPDVSFASAPNKEADDVIADLANRDFKVDQKIVYSGDKDMIQLTNTPDVIFSNKLEKGLFLDMAQTVLDASLQGCPKEYVTNFRALIGDDSDNIKPIVARIQKKLCLKIAKLFFEANNQNLQMTLEDAKARGDFTSSELKWVDLVSDRHTLSTYLLNYKLMDLRKYSLKENKLPINVIRSFQDTTRTMEAIELLKLEAYKNFLDYLAVLRTRKVAN